MTDTYFPFFSAKIVHSQHFLFEINGMILLKLEEDITCDLCRSFLSLNLIETHYLS